MSDAPKTRAEEAYCDLLTIPLPNTARDFRHAIVMAVLIGRQIEHDFQQQQNQQTKQTQTPE